MFPALYAILDATPGQPTESLVSYAQTLAAAGVRLLQVRAKRISPRQFLEMSRILVSGVPAGVRIIVNDRPDIASIARSGGRARGPGRSSG